MENFTGGEMFTLRNNILSGYLLFTRIQNPESRIQNPAPSIQHPNTKYPNIKIQKLKPLSSIQFPVPSIQNPESSTKYPASKYQVSKYQNSKTETSIQHPASSIQIPRIQNSEEWIHIINFHTCILIKYLINYSP